MIFNAALRVALRQPLRKQKHQAGKQEAHAQQAVVRFHIIQWFVKKDLGRQRGQRGDYQQQQRFVFNGMENHLYPILPKHHGNSRQRAHMQKNVKQELMLHVHAKQRLQKVQMAA